MLLKNEGISLKAVDGKGLEDHSKEGSKRFEEQQASGNVANRER
jgi:hypothetical protein